MAVFEHLKTRNCIVTKDHIVTCTISITLESVFSSVPLQAQAL